MAIRALTVLECALHVAVASKSLHMLTGQLLYERISFQHPRYKLFGTQSTSLSVFGVPVSGHSLASK